VDRGRSPSANSAYHFPYRPNVAASKMNLHASLAHGSGKRYTITSTRNPKSVARATKLAIVSGGGRLGGSGGQSGELELDDFGGMLFEVVGDGFDADADRAGGAYTAAAQDAKMEILDKLQPWRTA
jgi:hypothetical protein